MSDTRTERDSLGEMTVPAGALYGAQTARAIENFPVSGRAMPREFIAALGAIKHAAAETNAELGLLDDQRAGWIAAAAAEVIDGSHDGDFPVDVFQTGSGTSSNMNANEVVANRAIQLAGGVVGSKDPVHPNDHVNLGQSSNDVTPTALHVSAAAAIDRRLIPALTRLASALEAKAKQFDDVVKIGRTHLQDAVPIRLGQALAGLAGGVDQGVAVLQQAVEGLCRLAIGGTAVGTGLNAHPKFAAGVCKRLGRRFGLTFKPTDSRFTAQSQMLPAMSASAACKIAAAAMAKAASDIRLLGSGPRCGLGELKLPATQPGSSIMPGKVNPVICESVIQVACQVTGLDAAITAGAAGGVGSILELNVAQPMIAANLLEMIGLLTAAAEVFRTKCVDGLEADVERCRELIEQSLAMCTALAPEIGYDAAAIIAKQAYAEGKTVRQVALEQDILPPDRLEQLLDPRGQTGR